MAKYSGGLIIGRIFSSEIWETYFRESVFLKGLIIEILRYGQETIVSWYGIKTLMICRDVVAHFITEIGMWTGSFVGE